MIRLAGDDVMRMRTVLPAFTLFIPRNVNDIQILTVPTSSSIMYYPPTIIV